MKINKCYIIDDENYSIERLKENIKKTPQLKLIGSNTNPLLAVEVIRTGEKPDIVFLDIDMPELSGLDVAALLPKNIAIIFVTGHMDQAYNAFENNAIDFILKPYSFNRFVKAVQKAEKFLFNTDTFIEPSNNEKIFVKSGFKNTIQQLSVENIVNIEAFDHNVFIHTIDEKIIVNVRLKEIEETLPIGLFIRIHRTHIINVDLIKTIEGSQIHMTNGLILPLSKSYKEQFIRKIQGRMIKSTKA